MFRAGRALMGIWRHSVSQRTFVPPCDYHPNFSGVLARAFCDKGDVDQWVGELRKEMDLLFGTVPPGPAHPMQQFSEGNLDTHQPALDPSTQVFPDTESVVGVDSASHGEGVGEPNMANIANTVSEHVAVASGRVFLGSEAFDLVSANNIAKGDVLTVAKIAGIHGAKQTGSLIPLCHHIMLTGVDISLSLDKNLHAVDIRAVVTAVGMIGVEMQALTAVSVASLTVYDMCKAVSKDIRISNVQLEAETGEIV